MANTMAQVLFHSANYPHHTIAKKRLKISGNQQGVLFSISVLSNKKCYSISVLSNKKCYTIADLKGKLALEEHHATESLLKVVGEKRDIWKNGDRSRMLKFVPFKVGDTVMLKTPGLETAQKTTPVTSGPFVIHRIHGRNTYKLKDKDGKKLKFLVNGRRLAHMKPRANPPRNTPPDLEWEWFIPPSSVLTIKTSHVGKDGTVSGDGIVDGSTKDDH